MKRVKYSSSLTAAIVACLASAGAAQAQESTTAFLEEIVVTAQKRVEKLQDVPISVTVVDEKQLDNQSVYSIEDLARTSPSLEMVQAFGGPGGGGQIRGIGTNSFTRSAEGAVGIVVDGVPQGNVNVSNIFDMQRVEVLRGPQGTLFGLTSSAGVINMYLTFRAIMGTLTALAVSLLVGPGMIRRLAALKAGQVIRQDGPQSHLSKAGTPTMGGALILASIAASTLLWADLHNRYVWLVLAVTVVFGAIGFYDDYKKLVLKDSRGLAARWKYFWQSLGGLGAALFLFHTADVPAATALYLPFFKQVALPLGAFFFVLLGYLMIVGFSNAVNLTDGLDGLAIMPLY